MEIQDPVLPKKLPFYRSSNAKIIILMSVVILLVGIALFANIYGKISREKEAAVGNAGNTMVALQPNTNGNFSSGTTVNLESEEPVLVLNDFINLLLDNKKDEAEKRISEYSSTEYLKDFMDEHLGKKTEVDFDIMQIKYSPEKTFSYIAVESSIDGVRAYYRFTMIKINSDWKVFREEKI